MGEATETTPGPPAPLCRNSVPHGRGRPLGSPVSFSSGAGAVMLWIERQGQRVLARMALCAMLAVALWMFGY
jgi:hypothetical protein